jgi:integrase
MRYVQRRKLADGKTHYRFNPPQDLVDEGVVKRRELGTDLRNVRVAANRFNEDINKFRTNQEQIRNIKRTSTLSDLIDSYYSSNDFSMLRENTKQDYRYFLDILRATSGSKKFMAITTRDAKNAYESWVKRGVTLANHVCSCASIVFNYATHMEYTTLNPYKAVKKRLPKKRKVVWTDEEVIKMLDFCYSDFKYRSIGLIVQMAYEWCQRIGDMRELKWENVFLDRAELYLEQSKRRSQVFLPISDDLNTMLKQQKEDFGFQAYICPKIKPIQGVYVPYGKYEIGIIARRIMRKIGLSDELRLMDLRRTGVTQMVDAGVDISQIMSVTGHTNITSVQPYIKNTFTSANNALTTRTNHVKSITNADTESDI